MNTENFPTTISAESPFNLDNGDGYRRWRDWKLANRPRSVLDLLVEIADPLNISAGERQAVLDRVRASNMAIYVCANKDAPPEAVMTAIAGNFGLRTLDKHLCAEGDGITPLSVEAEGQRKRYIPYTDRPINWHTDGYYNEPRHRVRVFMMHCCSKALEGGENGLMDPEIAYIRIRDENPDYIEALCRPDAMTIPANEEDGQEIRGPQTGPVFFADPRDGSLQMRYTARTRSILWAENDSTTEAVQALVRVMADGVEDVYRHTLGPGEGVLTNNVLHCRTGFVDGDGPGKGRLMYRARFYDRV